jgi:outer membrane protein TolC
MTTFSRFWLPITGIACFVGIAAAAPAQEPIEPLSPAVQTNHHVDHFDELVVNPGLQLSEVLEKTYARTPMQASLQSRDIMVSARNRVANTLLPSAPAVNLIHQNDAIGSGRGERDWQAELELPVWLPKQRDNRMKVAEAIQASTGAMRQSLKLQVAGQLREAVWNIAVNENNLSLALNKLQVAKKLQSDVDKRYRAGELAKTDAMLAEQETLRVEKEKVRAEAELMHARHRYYVLTGLRELPGNYAEKQSALDDYSQSPVWLEAQSKVGLAETERDLAQVESHENMRVLLNVRSTKGAFDTTNNDSVGVHVRVPFGGEASAAPVRAAAEMVVGNALTEREAMRFELEAAMHEAEHNLSVSQAELIIAAKQHEIATESLTLAQKAFQLGETDLVSLLRVQAQSFEAERAFTTRQIQVQWDIARYNQTVGVLP